MDGNIPGRFPAVSNLNLEALNRDRAQRMAQRKYVNQVSELEVRARISCYHFVRLLPQTATVLYG